MRKRKEKEVVEFVTNQSNMASLHCSLYLFLLFSVAAPSHAFGAFLPQYSERSLLSVGRLGRRNQVANFMSPQDDEIDADSLGDWRDFRRGLSETGIITSESTDSNTNSKKSKKKSVSKQNEELLKSQNEELSQEYETSVWAHETGSPEVGGLVCRLPLEVELYKNGDSSALGKILQDQLEKDDGTKKSKTIQWYRKSYSIIQKELGEMVKAATPGGSIDSSKLSAESLELLNMYIENQDSWQEVCLVTQHNQENGKLSTVVINRPMATKLTENLAKLVLFGAWQPEAEKVGTSKGVSRTAQYLQFLSAFENECGLYVGGPKDQDKPAMLIHGIKDLEGAVELSPGTNIYQGGLDAAIEGVLSGKYSPLDFRFFVGRYEYSNKELDAKIALGKYVPVACGRSLALKQCIGLPKPLWHEVMELCGDELGVISSLELLKRDDLAVIQEDGDFEEEQEEEKEITRVEDTSIVDDEGFQ